MLQLGQVRLEGVDLVAVLCKGMALDQAEELEDLLGGGVVGGALFGVEGQVVEVLSRHRLP